MAFEKTPARRMDVVDALTLAINRAKRLLFEPFNFGTWIRFGFIAFMASLAVGGGGGGGGSHGGGGREIKPGMAPAEALGTARDWFVENMALILTVGGLILLLVAILAVLLLWLGSRGQMMLIRSTAKGDAGIKRNWSATRKQGNSVFKFRLVLMTMGLVVFGSLATLLVYTILGLIQEEGVGWLAFLLALAPQILFIVAMAFCFGFVELLLRSFVMPLMYKDDLYCLEGWKGFRSLAAGNIAALCVFFVIRFAYHIPFAIATFMVGLFTLLLGFLPVIHHTIFAPFYVFDRAYSLYAIESLGPEYAIFDPDAAPDADAFQHKPPPLLPEQG
jgi:hypothetical protein